MVFRATKGVDENILEKWESEDIFNEDSTTAKQLDSDFKGVYKSSMVEEWGKYIIDQVKVAVYEGKEEKAYFIFNGLASTKNDWFTRERRLASSYTDLKQSSGNFFSIRGQHNWSHHFYMSKQYCGCECDRAWFVIPDVGSTVCLWMEKEPRPYFMYCPNGLECNMDKEALVASTFAIFIKTKPL